MTWFKVDDDLPDNFKVALVGSNAAWLYVCGLAYCNRNLTDGRIPRGVAARLTVFDDPGLACPDVIPRLLEAGLWTQNGTGFIVHDYLKHQRSKADVLAERTAARERMAEIRARKKASAKGSPELLKKFAVRSPEVRLTEVVQEQDLALDLPSTSKSKSKPLAPRKQDELWDTLVEIFGASAQGIERGRWNKALQSLRLAEATPETLRAAAATWPKLFSGATMTATALAANWTTLTASAKTPVQLEQDRLRDRIAREEEERENSELQWR